MWSLNVSSFSWTTQDPFPQICHGPTNPKMHYMPVIKVICQTTSTDSKSILVQIHSTAVITLKRYVVMDKKLCVVIVARCQKSSFATQQRWEQPVTYNKNSLLTGLSKIASARVAYDSDEGPHVLCRSHSLKDAAPELGHNLNMAFRAETIRGKERVKTQKLFCCTDGSQEEQWCGLHHFGVKKSVSSDSL